MYTTIFAVLCGVCIACLYLFTRWKVRREYRSKFEDLDRQYHNDIEIVTAATERMKDITEEMIKRASVAEQAISSQIVDRSSEVGSPPPSGAYHTVFFPTGDGHIMMVYLCLDSGHVARWHFYDVETLESEGERLISVAQQVREGTLPTTPEFLNVQVGNNGMIH